MAITFKYADKISALKAPARDAVSDTAAIETSVKEILAQVRRAATRPCATTPKPSTNPISPCSR